MLEAPPPRPRWRWVALGALAARGLGLAALAAGAGKRLEEALKPFWEAQPLRVVILAVLLLAILGGAPVAVGQLLAVVLRRYRRKASSAPVTSRPK